MSIGTLPAPSSQDGVETFLQILLADYSERCQDYRRQVGYYPRIVFIITAVITTSLGWVFSSLSPDANLWLLPIAVLVCELALSGAVYVYWSSSLMRVYIVQTEHVLNRFGMTRAEVHPINAAASPKIALGFHYWLSKNLRLTRRRALRYAAMSVVGSVYFLVLAMMWITGSQHSFYTSHTALSRIITVAAIGIPFAFLLQFIRLFIRNRDACRALPDLGLVTEQPAPTSESEREATLSDLNYVLILTRDYQERNLDYRSRIDNYYPFLTLAVTVLTATFSLYLIGNNQWVFLLLPLVMATIPFFLIHTYRAAKPLKEYLARIEQELNRVASQVSPGTPDAHPETTHRSGFVRRQRRAAPAFHIGFIGVVREVFWARTKGSAPAPHNFLTAALMIAGFFLLLAVFHYKAYAWLSQEHPAGLPYFWVSVVLTVLVLAADLVLYFEAGPMTHEENE